VASREAAGDAPIRRVAHLIDGHFTPRRRGVVLSTCASALWVRAIGLFKNRERVDADPNPQALAKRRVDGGWLICGTLVPLFYLPPRLIALALQAME